MTERYCDLANDFSNPANVGDTSGNPANGPGGFMAMIHGWGLHDQMTAGDTLWLKGTADLQKLIEITVNVDKSGTWNVGDVVRNHNTGGGAVGDDWVGVLAFINATTLWVQIDAASSDIDSVSTSDGVNNLVSDEIVGANMTAATAPGIDMDGCNSGDTTTGRIHYRGTLDLTDPENNLGQAVLDGFVNESSSASIKGILDSAGADNISLEYITVDSVSDDGFTIGTSSVHWEFGHCRAINCSDYGFYARGTRVLMMHCIARSCGDSGIRTYNAGHVLFCLSTDNDGSGFYADSTGFVLVGCVAVNSLSDGFRGADSTLLVNCVGAGSRSGSGWLVGSATTVEHCMAVGCRFTDNDQYGIEAGVAGMEHENFEDYNVIFKGSGVGTRLNMLAGPNSIDDSANSGMDADYNVDDGADLDALAVVLNWDEV